MPLEIGFNLFNISQQWTCRRRNAFTVNNSAKVDKSIWGNKPQNSYAFPKLSMFLRRQRMLACDIFAKYYAGLLISLPFCTAVEWHSSCLRRLCGLRALESLKSLSVFCSVTKWAEFRSKVKHNVP